MLIPCTVKIEDLNQLIRERSQLNSIRALTKRHTRQMPEDASPLARVEAMVEKMRVQRMEITKLRLTIKQKTKPSR